MSAIKFENGTMNPQEWLKESDVQLTSSKILREAGKTKFDEFTVLKTSKNAHSGANRKKCMNLICEKEAAYKCSILLLGYAIELALKAGIVKYYKNIPKHLTEKSLKQNYSHKLNLMADELGINLTKREVELLDLMVEFLLEKARYPLSADNREEYAKKWMINNGNLQSDTLYNELLALQEKIIQFTKHADKTSKNPVSSGTLNIDDNGYLSFRFGGNLPTRVTYKYSDSQIKNKENNLESLKLLLLAHSDQHPYFQILSNNWDDIDFFEHLKNDKLKKRT
ncbi:hypothetical protein M3P05_20385 [Sansalvadorimonas sp. 2012CJ34-2]|uniref:Uncharacterized protein n=1 Tax=Parendozoicomonas callyspongiae TaxID=2942213 RepID=A0ABT0PLM7_9GAMM|nr:hypothetical protein [Sansalvadorimonas sp. 2012CJ34-2]MCL6272279.1 hypothetical protein [Sansalvadorimonas sp. 2012CJ34-2]